ncbi:MAG: GNAT family N-acetyltransferase [Acidobacteria bacterium]|nr:GNAT family N-acetyltransferase [Acidobacteriota bacterium]
MRIEKVTTREGFQALQPIWNALLEQSASNALSLTYEWLSTWWDVFHQGRELYLLVARDENEVIGIAPLLKRTVQHYGVLPFRRLEFLASGEDEADEICSDYLDFILRRGRESEALDLMLRYLYENDADWDEILFTDMCGESANLPLIKAFCEDYEINLRQVRDEMAIFLPLPNSFAEVMQNVGGHFRRRIRQDRKAFANYGGAVRVIKKADEFAAGFTALVDLHQGRWTARGNTGVFSSEKFLRFHRRFAQQAMEKDWLRLYLALKDGKPIAATYNFVYKKKVFYYQSGFQLANSGLLSPGVFIQSHSIEDAIREGLTEFDFLKGRPDSYKFKWKPETRSLVQMRLAQSHTKEALYNTTAKFIGGLRNIKRSLKTTAAS